MNLLEIEELLIQRIRSYGSVCIAYSGGVDSTLLLSLAQEALPGKITAIVASGAFIPGDEILEAVENALAIGVTPVVIPVDFLGNPAVAANMPDRCYHCKTMIFSALTKTAQSHGSDAILDGTNADDLSDYRPGMKALKELGIVSIFLDEGISKAVIRQLSEKRALPTAAKPALSCMASRIPTGEAITAEALHIIEAGEALLKKLGFRQYRVRIHNNLARIEVDVNDFGRLLDNRQAMVEQLKTMGIKHIAMDLDGYKTGNMNL